MEMLKSVRVFKEHESTTPNNSLEENSIKNWRKQWENRPLILLILVTIMCSLLIKEAMKTHHPQSTRKDMALSILRVECELV